MTKRSTDRPVRPSRGLALQTMILIILVSSTIILVFAHLFTRFMFFDQAMRVKRKAKTAAESAASMAIVRLTEMEPEFGEDEKGEITLPKGLLSEEQSGYVQFDPKDGRPWSTNNFDSDSVVSGYNGQPVPAHGAHIIAVGQFGGRTVLYEVVITRPGITHAAASSGELTLDGKNEAASIDTLEQLDEMTQSGQVDSKAVEDKLRGTTVAAGGETGNPLVLQGDLVLYGNAVSKAGIVQGAHVQFLRGGLPQAHSRKVEIPKIKDITAYNPSTLDDVTNMQASYNGSTPFQSRNYRDGDLVIEGDVNLNGALIYATGNIHINGSVTGEGGIISEKNVVITGHSQVKADSKVAVIAGGDLTIQGTGTDRSLFSGLIYGQGQVKAGNVSIVGGIVSNNPNDPQSAKMEVNDVRLINLPEKTKFDISKVIKAPPLPGAGGNLNRELRRHNLELVNPDLGSLLGPNGTWNGVAPSFRFKDTKTGAIYSSLSAVPGLDESTARDLGNMMTSDFVPGFEAFLGTLTPQNTQIENIFQLDPNQLLTVSGGYKVLLRRSLEG